MDSECGDLVECQPYPAVYEHFGTRVLDEIDLEGRRLTFVPTRASGSATPGASPGSHRLRRRARRGNRLLHLDLGDDDTEEYPLAILEGFDFSGPPTPRSTSDRTAASPSARGA